MHRALTSITRTAALGGLLWFAGGCGEGSCTERATPGSICTIAGTGELGFNRDGKGPLETDFFLVSRARHGPDGLLYFSDFNNWRIRRLEGGVVQTIAGNGFHAGGVLGALASESPLDNPFDLDFLPDGRLVSTSFEDPRVLSIESDGTIGAVAGNGQFGVIGNEGDGGPALEASFIAIEGIAVGPDGTIYLSDSGAYRIRVIEEGIVSTLAGSGTPGYSGDGGSALEARFSQPTALALDEAGNLFVADSFAHVVRKIAADGTIATVAGSGTRGQCGDDGPATEACLNEPYGLAVAEDGTLYIADRSNFRVRRVTPDGTITTIAGTDEGYSGDGGPATKAQMGYLARITLEGDSLLVADQSNAVIRQVFFEDTR